MDELMFMDDTFGANRAAAHQIVKDLLEMWTPERKDEIIQSMTKRGASLVDHVTIGDYDLVLWHYPKINAYAASINSGQEDPTTMDGQEKRPRSQHLNWHSVVVQLQKWVKSHGRILISSTHRNRIGQYRKLLTRHFLTAEWSEWPDAGFFILPD